MAPVGGTTAVRRVSPWVFWGAFAASLGAIMGLWLLTLPMQWSVAEVPLSDPPRWSLLDAGDPAGRLKSQMVEVKDNFDQTKDALTNLPVKIEQAEKFRLAGEEITTKLESQPEPVLVTPPLTPKP